MRFVIAYVGIPFDFYDLLLARKPSFARDVTFHGIPLNANQISYHAGYYQNTLNYFCDLIANDHHNRLNDTAFAVIAVHQDEASTASFATALFPSVYLATVNWIADRSTPTRKRASANALGEAFRQKTDDAKTALRLIGDEVVARSNQTPLLLPLANFASQVLHNEVKTIHEEIGSAHEPRRHITDTINRIRHSHPFNRPPGWDTRAYIDNQNVIFKSPGQLRHGFARPNGHHPASCLLAGKRRLGAPYDPAFHYDCTRLHQPTLRGNFVNCHAINGGYRGDPHLNIAPNDFVRA